MLHVTDCFAKSLKVTQGHSNFEMTSLSMGVCKFLLVSCFNYVYTFYRF